MKLASELARIRTGIYVLCAVTITTAVINLWYANHIHEKYMAVVNTQNPGALFYELEDLLETGDLEAVKVRCRAEIAAKPLSSTGHYFLGLVHYHEGEPAECRRMLEKAVKLSPALKGSVLLYLNEL